MNDVLRDERADVIDVNALVSLGLLEAFSLIRSLAVAEGPLDSLLSVAECLRNLAILLVSLPLNMLFLL